MINKPPPFKRLDTRIPIIVPIKGRGFINQGSTLAGLIEGGTWGCSRAILSLG